MILRSALYRKEPRGFQYRENYPLTDTLDWLKWIMVKKERQEMRVWAKEFPTPYIKPPEKNIHRANKVLLTPSLSPCGRGEGRGEESAIRGREMSVEQIKKERCKNCGRCLDVCPMDVFQKLAGQIFVAYPDDCVCCYLSEIECPTDALTVTGKRAREIPFPY